MKGHIRERSPGHWAIILDVPGEDGKRRRKWQAFKGTKRESQAECARLITELKAGAYVEQHRQTLNDFLDRWERDWAATNVSPKTNERYSELLRTHVRPHIGAKPIQSIRVEDLNRLYSDLHQKIAPRTVKHIHRLLHRVLGHATKWGTVKRNVVALVDAPKVQATEAPALQLSEIPTMLTGLRGRVLYPIAVVALGTGMRRGELCALRWQDVDLDAASLRVERSLEETRKGGAPVQRAEVGARPAHRIAVAGRRCRTQRPLEGSAGATSGPRAREGAQRRPGVFDLGRQTTATGNPHERIYGGNEAPRPATRHFAHLAAYSCIAAHNFGHGYPHGEPAPGP